MALGSSKDTWRQTRDTGPHARGHTQRHRTRVHTHGCRHGTQVHTCVDSHTKTQDTGAHTWSRHRTRVHTQCHGPTETCPCTRSRSHLLGHRHVQHTNTHVYMTRPCTHIHAHSHTCVRKHRHIYTRCPAGGGQARPGRAARVSRRGGRLDFNGKLFKEKTVRSPDPHGRLRFAEGPDPTTPLTAAPALASASRPRGSLLEGPNGARGSAGQRRAAPAQCHRWPPASTGCDCWRVGGTYRVPSPTGSPGLV